MTRKLIFASLLGCLFLVGRAQNPQIFPVQYPKDKDIVGKVNCIYTDRIGFVWFGTETGLFRFDGTEMKSFKNNPQDTASISSNNILSITGDSVGNLWIGTRGGGLNKYIRATGRFLRYLHNDNNPWSLSFDEVFTILPDSKGNLWIGTDGGGLNYFDPETEKFECIRESKSSGLRSNKILSMTPTGNGKYWLGTWAGGLHLFDPATKKIQQIGNGTRFANCCIFSIKEVKTGELWISTFDEGLLAYNIVTGKFSTIVPTSAILYFNDIEVTAKGDVYVASCNHLLYFPGKGYKYQMIESNASTPFVSISSIFLDNRQTLWVGSVSGNLGTVYPFRKQFHTFPSSFSHTGNPVFAMLADTSNNNMVFTSQDQLVSYNFSTHHYKPIRMPFLHNITMAWGPSKNTILLAAQKSLILFNYENGRFAPPVFNTEFGNTLTKKEIQTMYTTNKKTYWIATSPMAVQISYEEGVGKWNYVKSINTGGKDGLSKAHYPTSFLKSPLGDFWIGTCGGGLNQLKPESQHFTHVMHQANNPNSITNNFIECLATDFTGNLLAGTQAGLSRINTHTLKISNLTTSNGLANDWIMSIAVSAKNQVWVSTRMGISSISPDFKTIKNYDVNDGLPSNEFLPRSVATDKAGNMYFGSKKGLVWFHPDSIRDNPYFPEIAIVDFKINEKKVEIGPSSPLKQNIEIARKIQLAYNQSSFLFQMAALSYFNPQQNQIIYKLDGYDKEWQTAGNERLAVYSEIPTGSYIFRVRAANEDGVWNPNEHQISIIISPPFWWRWPAKLLYLATILALVWAFYFRTRKFKNLQPQTIGTEPGSNWAFDAIQPSVIVKEPADQIFLQKAMAIVEENIADPEFGVYQLADKLNISRTSIYRKITNLTGVSIVEFIKIVRIKRAGQLLLQKPGSISEVAFQVGFNDPKYFSRCFKQLYGVSPAQFITQNSKPEAN